MIKVHLSDSTQQYEETNIHYLGDFLDGGGGGGSDGDRWFTGGQGEISLAI